MGRCWPAPFRATRACREKAGTISIVSKLGWLAMMDRKEFLQYLEALECFASEIEEAVSDQPDELPTGCQAAQELTKCSTPALLETAFSQGSMLSSVVRDLFRGLTRSLKEPVLSIAPWSNARGVLESAALGSWLLDPTVGEYKRISRSLALRCDGQHQQMSLSKVTNPTVNLKKSETRLDKIIKEAAAAGYPEVRVKSGKKKGRLMGVGEQMPRTTELIESVLGKGAIYKIMCSMVHAAPWALQQLGFQPVVRVTGEPEKVAGKGGDLFLFKKGIPMVSMKLLALETAEAIYEIHNREWTLFGRDVKRLEKMQGRFFGRFPHE